MPGGSTFRQCTHCLKKINCANRRCTKCGKLLDMKLRQTARMKVFRTRAKEWAQKVKKSRNQAKIFDNSALLVEKLKALGYFPLLLWGKYRPQNKRWMAQLQCPFELPVVAHAVLEKIVCLYEGLLEACDPEREEVGQQERIEEDGAERKIDDEDQRGQGEQREIGETERRDMQEMEAQDDRVESKREERGEMEGQKDFEELGLMEKEEMEADKEREQTEELGKKVIEAKKKVVAANRSAVKISAKKKRSKRSQNKNDACQYHSTLEIFPVDYVSKTREKKGLKEVLVHWLPCPSCKKSWPPSWEPQENIGMTLEH